MLARSVVENYRAPTEDDGESTTDDGEESRDLVTPLKSATPSAAVVSDDFVVSKDPITGRRVLGVPMVRSCFEEIAGANVKRADFFFLQFRDGIEYFVRLGNGRLLSYQGPFENAGRTRAACIVGEGKRVLEKVNWAVVLSAFLDAKWPVPSTARIDFMLIADKLIVRCSGLVDGALASSFRVTNDDGTRRTIANDDVVQFRFTFKEIDKLPSAYASKGLPSGREDDDVEPPLGKRPKA